MCKKRDRERKIIHGYEHCFKASFSILLFTSVEEVALTSFIPLYIRLFFVLYRGMLQYSLRFQGTTYYTVDELYRLSYR